MHFRRTVTALLLASLSILNASARSDETSGKKPWEWSEGERIAARTDAVAAAARVRADTSWHAESKGVRALSAETAQPFDVIDGKRHPELLLTQEVFDPMIKLAFADDPITRSAYRESKEQYRKQLGLPVDFWDRLGVISAAYIADRRREREVAFSNLAEADRAAKGGRVSHLICRDRFAALSEARALFGDRFDQFLYRAIAPETSVLALRAPDPTAFKSMSEGCHGAFSGCGSIAIMTALPVSRRRTR